MTKGQGSAQREEGSRAVGKLGLLHSDWLYEIPAEMEGCSDLIWIQVQEEEGTFLPKCPDVPDV